MQIHDFDLIEMLQKFKYHAIFFIFRRGQWYRNTNKILVSSEQPTAKIKTRHCNRKFWREQNMEWMKILKKKIKTENNSIQINFLIFKHAQNEDFNVTDFKETIIIFNNFT